jgi:hypothetical protein
MHTLIHHPLSKSSFATTFGAMDNVVEQEPEKRGRGGREGERERRREREMNKGEIWRDGGSGTRRD